MNPTAIDAIQYDAALADVLSEMAKKFQYMDMLALLRAMDADTGA